MSAPDYERRRAPGQPCRYGLRMAAPGVAVRCKVSIMARAAAGQNGSRGRAAQIDLIASTVLPGLRP